MSQAIETVIVGPATGVGGSRPLGLAGLTRLRPGLWAAGFFVALLLLAAALPHLIAPDRTLRSAGRLGTSGFPAAQRAALARHR